MSESTLPRARSGIAAARQLLQVPKYPDEPSPPQGPPAKSMVTELMAAGGSGEAPAGASFLDRTLGDLSNEARQVVRAWLQEWEQSVKLRMEQDVQMITNLVLSLDSSFEHAHARDPSTPAAQPGAADPFVETSFAMSHTRTAARADTDGLGEFVLMPLWTEEVPPPSTRIMSRSFASNLGSEDSKTASHKYRADAPRWSRIMIYPGSHRKVVWDLIGAILIFYDLFSISLQVFDVYDEPKPQGGFDFGNVISFVSLLFWTANMGVSLLVGYVEDGVTVMDPHKILRRYLKTWFLVDILVVGLDWTFTCLALSNEQDSNAGNSVRLLRVLRIFRMLRLARLLKLRTVLQSFYDLIDSEFLGIFADIGMMLVLLFVFCHVIACMWFWVGTQDAGYTWVKDSQFESVGWMYQYATSFHWAITQFTPASMNVQPQNLFERMFAIVIVYFGLVTFSYVVGSITGSLTQLRMMRENVSTQFWELRRYMRKHKVNPLLCLRIYKYLEHVLEIERKSMPAKNVRLLGLLSMQLKSELECEICMPTLSVHPLFKSMRQSSQITMHRVANTAIEPRRLARTDIAFVSTEAATNMYFVVRGQLKYQRLDSQGEWHREEVDRKDWIAEPVLWMKHWTHLGELEAETECDLVLLHPNKFQDVIRLNPVALSLACTYARNFIVWINSEDRDSLSDIWHREAVDQRARQLMEVHDGSLTVAAHTWKNVIRPTRSLNGDASASASASFPSANAGAFDTSACRTSGTKKTQQL